MAQAGLVRIRRSEQAWREIMERYKSSGMTQAAFCDAEELSITSFQKWRAKLKASSFVELPQPAISTPSWCVEMHLPDGSKIRFSGDV